MHFHIQYEQKICVTFIDFLLDFTSFIALSHAKEKKRKVTKSGQFT